jgi:hypothetical protein
MLRLLMWDPIRIRPQPLEGFWTDYARIQPLEPMEYSRQQPADSEDVTRKEVLRVMRYVDEEKRRRQG